MAYAMKPASLTPDLFDMPLPLPPPAPEAYARNTDPPTAHAAAESVTPHVTALQAIVVAALRELGPRGGTSYELAGLTKLDRVTVSPRLRPLVVAGLVVDSGQRRPGPTGKPGIVWRLA